MSSFIAKCFVFIGLALAVAGCTQQQATQGPVNPVTGGVHVRGKADSKVTVIEYGDFQCPACEQAYPHIEDLFKRYGDRVAFSYRHFPLPQHQFAQKAAEAAEAAGAQGKFWEMYNLLFSDQSHLAVSDAKAYAAKLGLDTARFDRELDAGTYADIIKKDLQSGIDAGVDATPSFFVGTQKIVGDNPQQIEDAITKALQ